MEEEYRKSLAEVVDIIDNSEEEIINKIPKKTYELFKNNMDTNYIVDIDYSDKNWESNLREYTKEILALIYVEYLVTSEKRKQILKEEAQETAKKEKYLLEKYDPENLFKLETIIEKRDEEQNDSITSLVEYKESLFIKLKNLILKILKRKA